MTLRGPVNSVLLQRWQTALRFRIGVEGITGLDQLPNPASFPSRFAVDEFGHGHFLGEVLGVAALKLFRTGSTAFPGQWSFDHIGQWLQALGCADPTTDCGQRATVHRVIDLAFHSPECLPLLFARLDELTNDDLHRMAMDAVQGVPVRPDVFAGTEGSNDGALLNQLLVGFLEVLSIELKASDYAPRYALGVALRRHPEAFTQMIISQFRAAHGHAWETEQMGVLRGDK